MTSDAFRANNPRFVGGNFEQNMGIVPAVEMVAKEVAGGALRGHVQDQPVGLREG